MTTTTKAANGKGSKAAEPIGDGWDDAPKAAGLTDSPEWLPHLSIYNEEERAEKLSVATDGSHAETVVVGRLIIEQAYGEPRYFVEQEAGKDGKGKSGKIAMPVHAALTTALDHFAVENNIGPRVRIAYAGRAKRAKEGQQAAFLYDARCQPANAYLQEPRKDALQPVHAANKEKRDAEKKGKGKKGKTDDTATEA